MFKICEHELNLLDVAINTVRNRPVFALDIEWMHHMIRCLDPQVVCTIPWVKELRYLSFHRLQSRTFKCLLSNHRKAFYRSANAIFGKIGRIASEDEILPLIKSKCIPSLLHGVDACALTKSELSSLDFIVNRFFNEII